VTHITDAYRFREILESGQLQPSYCPVFEEALLYLFYGRPAYRVNLQAQSSGIEAYVPVCFVMKPQILVKPRRLFPFDTGAFPIMEAAFHHRMIRGDFSLGTNPELVDKLVALFFGNLSNYYDNKPIDGVAIPPFEFEAHSYYRLINDQLKAKYDERISAIEIQLSYPVPLEPNTIAVIMPSNLADQPSVVTRIDAAGAVAIPYDYRPRLRPEQYTSELYSIVKGLYRREGYL
jgi:hypothetical protein